MACVLTIDQRGSRDAPLRVSEWCEELNRRFKDKLTLPFEITVGDEMQAVAASAEPVIFVVSEGAREEKWWAGVGIGSVSLPLGPAASQSRGEAFYRARDAVNKAKRAPYGFACEGDGADELTVMLRLLLMIHKKRKPKGWEAVELAGQDLTHEEIATQLGISRQAVGQRLDTASYDEELAIIRLIEKFLEPRLDLR